VEYRQGIHDATTLDTGEGIMDWHVAFKGNYIAAAEIGDKKPMITISKVGIVKMEKDDGRTKDGLVVHMQGTDRGWVLCKTNAICLAALFGNETDAWVGKRVVLYSTLVQFGKDKVPGIRILGSPDIEATMSIEVKLPKKKARAVTLQKTNGKAEAKSPQAHLIDDAGAAQPPLDDTREPGSEG
jgi:hypothetical protein